MNRKLIIAFLFGIALTLQAVNTNGAQRKEGPGLAPITVSVDAQRKEKPAPAPSLADTIRGWLSRISLDAQRKE